MLSPTRELELKQQIHDLVMQAYRECGQTIGLLRGKYLVRVLPKEQMSPSGMIVLADLGGAAKQNKPMYEAVVLETYSPYYRVWHEEVAEDDFKECKEIFEPMVSVGNHILMEHWVGAPVPCLDLGAGEYRIIHEHDIIATVEYETAKLSSRLVGMLVGEDLSSIDNAQRLAEELLVHFNVVSRNVSCKTLSGK